MDNCFRPSARSLNFWRVVLWALLRFWWRRRCSVSKLSFSSLPRLTASSSASLVICSTSSASLSAFSLAMNISQSDLALSRSRSSADWVSRTRFLDFNSFPSFVMEPLRVDILRSLSFRVRVLSCSSADFRHSFRCLPVENVRKILLLKS